MERRLAVILMADMVEYSAAMGRDQSGTIELIRELRERWLEPEAERRGGRILKRMGDGWIIAFLSVTEAVETAQAVQQALAGHEKIQLRVAVHLGEIAEDEADVYGAGINIAARLQTEAPPGGVMISEDLKRQLDARLAQDFGDAGTFELKNVANPVNGFQWRPVIKPKVGQFDVPAIAVERVTSAPETQETLEVSADLQEQLVHNLSRRTGVRVLATDSLDDAEATYSLRCRLRCRDSEAKITASLTRLSDGQVVWSRVFFGDPRNLFALTDRAAEQLSDALRLQINAFDGDRLADIPDDQLSASELRARAAMLFYRATVSDYRHALDLLERALSLDPQNGSALAMWSEGQLFILEACFDEAEAALREKIIRFSNKAVQASPRSDYSWYVRAHVRARLCGDVEGARKDIDRITQLNPGYVLGMEARGVTELVAGNWVIAAKSLTDAVERSADDPFLPFRLYLLAIAQLMAGEPQPALATISDATELRPDCRHYWLVRAWILSELGRNQEANTAAETAESAPKRPDILAQNVKLPSSVREAIGLPTVPLSAKG
ncbi:adenylate/guanylate cyclase domain-containing protein [Ruegeria profundi]|uniref:adenylate/guanylate cyclase domain-containing protein n=1 Tax=Ruegeria profundi TaxID=1685378 RepID=UPI001CD33078|nr:hypothetical protein [Ruegeria profundi]MCA0927938.1 hypothetical protein [Ruegeria profundi]